MQYILQVNIKFLLPFLS